MSVEKLMKLKRDIEQAKLDEATAQGALKQCLDRLKTDFNCKTTEQAKTKLKEMKEQYEELEEEIEESLKELEEEYAI